MRRTRLVLMLLGLMVPSIAIAQDVKIGLLPRLPEKELLVMFTPLAQYLEKETGRKVSLVIPKDFSTFTQQAIAGEFHLGFANPNIYIVIRKETPEAEPLGLASEPGVGTKLQGVFFVVKESPIKNLQDLKGKKVCFVDQGSAAGYIAQMLELQKAGIKPSDIQIIFAGKPPKVGEMVRDGAADAGGMPASVYARLPFDFMLRTIGKTADLPNWPFFTTKAADKAMADQFKEALLKLKPKTAQADRVLSMANLEGFVPTTDADFQVMREAAKAAGVF